MKLEQESFELILHSGNSRSLSMEALDLIKKFLFKEADEKLKESKRELLLAQRKHAELLRNFANEELDEINILMVHAEDHVSSSETILLMAQEVYAIYLMVKGEAHE